MRVIGVVGLLACLGATAEAEDTGLLAEAERSADAALAEAEGCLARLLPAGTEVLRSECYPRPFSRCYDGEDRTDSRTDYDHCNEFGRRVWGRVVARAVGDLRATMADAPERLEVFERGQAAWETYVEAKCLLQTDDLAAPDAGCVAYQAVPRAAYLWSVLGRGSLAGPALADYVSGIRAD